MTVNKVGRPSKASERRLQIFGAVTEVIAADGLGAVTTARVAKTAGLTRTLVHHYFASRDALVEQYVTFAVAEYGEALLRQSEGLTVHEAIAAALDDSAYPEPQLLTAWLDLVAAASRDPSVAAQLNRLWTELWLPTIESALAQRYPAASAGQIAGTAFCLTALIEAFWAFRGQLTSGHDLRRAQVTEGCRHLVDQLASA